MTEKELKWAMIAVIVIAVLAFIAAMYQIHEQYNLAHWCINKGGTWSSERDYCTL